MTPVSCHSCISCHLLQILPLPVTLPPAESPCPSTVVKPPWPAELFPAFCSLCFPSLLCPPWHLCPKAWPHSSSHPSPARGAEGPLCMCSLGDINPRLHAPTKQRKHLLTAKALTNSAFQMNPAPRSAEGGEDHGEKSSKHSLVFADYRKTWGLLDLYLLSRCAVRFLQKSYLWNNDGTRQGSVRMKTHKIQLNTFLYVTESKTWIIIIIKKNNIIYITSGKKYLLELIQCLHIKRIEIARFQNDSRNMASVSTSSSC